jgi:hypothetical protein
MQRKLFALLLPPLTALALMLASCEQSPAPTPENESAPTTAPSAAPSPALATSLPASMPATTRATTQPSTTQAASRPADPLATPESAVRALLELSQQHQVPSLEKIISWMIEPPPDQELVQKLNQIRRPLIRGGSWEIGESITHGSAAVVLYTIKPPPSKPGSPPGKPITAPMLLIHRYGRWKMVFGELTPVRYTEDEKNDMLYVMDWGRKKIPAIDRAIQQASTRSVAPPPEEPPPPP